MQHFINEPRLYNLTLRSEMCEAKAFKRWVCSEVLPSIKKYGAYETKAAAIERIRNPTGETKLHGKNSEAALQDDLHLRASGRVPNGRVPRHGQQNQRLH